MIYILLSACCSVIVAVLLKLARRYSIDVFQAITWNYSMAILLTWLFFRPNLQAINVEGLPLQIFASVGLLLPALFVVIALAVRTAGIVRTDVAQRLSLLLSLTAAFWLFKEQITALKVAGLLVGLVSVFCCIPWQKQPGEKHFSSMSWIYLIVVFIGMGVIDILFKHVAVIKVPAFTTSLFIIYTMSFAVSLIVMLVMIFAGKLRFTLRHIGFGWILGVANFGNILFYLKAHQAVPPSTVFSVMNISVIVLGTLIGLIVFKEKLSTVNKVGLALALVAIVLISIAKTA